MTAESVVVQIVGMLAGGAAIVALIAAVDALIDLWKYRHRRRRR